MLYIKALTRHSRTLFAVKHKMDLLIILPKESGWVL